jgi:hypothetical protein
LSHVNFRPGCDDCFVVGPAGFEVEEEEDEEIELFGAVDRGGAPVPGSHPPLIGGGGPLTGERVMQVWCPLGTGLEKRRTHLGTQD